MQPRTVLLVLLAVGAAGGTAYMARSWVQAERNALLASQQAATPLPTAEAKQETVEVLVAAEALPAGRILKNSDLRWQTWPDTDLAASYIVKGEDQGGDGEGPASPDTLAGAVVRTGMQEGEPVTIGRVVRPGDRGFLAAMLRPGYRAMAVPVNAASGIAGLIFPGDRVDVVLTHVFDRDQDAGQRLYRASETILNDIRVLALDQRTDDQEGKPVIAKTATLELTAKQVERLTVAKELGLLSLSLRPIAREDGDTPGGAKRAKRATFTTDTQVSRLLPGRKNERSTGPTVEVVRGDKAEQIAFDRRHRRAVQ